jgi:hypothetical protein
MTLPSHRQFSDEIASAQTTSIGTTPVAGVSIAPCDGFISEVMAAAGGTTTGTITVAVAVNGGSDIASGALQIAAGTGARNGASVAIPLVGSSAVYVNKGDFIAFTPSGGTGSSIPGAFAAVIREK